MLVGLRGLELELSSNSSERRYRNGHYINLSLSACRSPFFLLSKPGSPPPTHIPLRCSADQQSPAPLRKRSDVPSIYAPPPVPIPISYPPSLSLSPPCTSSIPYLLGLLCLYRLSTAPLPPCPFFRRRAVISTARLHSIVWFEAAASRVFPATSIAEEAATASNLSPSLFDVRSLQHAFCCHRFYPGADPSTQPRFDLAVSNTSRLYRGVKRPDCCYAPPFKSRSSAS